MSSTVNAATDSSRITGLFSDMDTDAIVKNMCSKQQSKIDKQDQTKIKYEWYQESVKSVIDKVKEFQNSYCSALGSSSMLKSSTYYTFKIDSDSSSKAVSISAGTSALEGDYSVKVLQLAQSANVSSSAKISANGSEICSSNTATLSELSFKNKLQFDSNGKISFAINGKSFSFAKDTSLQSMINTINTDADANVTMKYSRLTDSFTITSNENGKNSSVAIQNLSGNAFGENSAFMIAEGTSKNGSDSIAEINGVTVTKDSNDYSVDGVNFKLKAVTAGTSEETLNFSVNRDYSATVDAISSFVTAFNDMISSLTDLTNEKDYSKDYPPLTDAQKEEMTDEQVKAWNEKAKSGVLRHDKDLERLITSLKESFFSSLGGTGKTAASIGISTGNYFSSEKGQITIDKDTLTAALEKNPDEVITMFTNGSSSSGMSEQGVVYKMRNTFTSYLKSANSSVVSFDDKIDLIDIQTTKLKDKLDDLASKYYNKFSSMETALAKLNSQSTYISQLFSS